LILRTGISNSRNAIKPAFFLCVVYLFGGMWYNRSMKPLDSGSLPFPETRMTRDYNGVK
jgi:hypothetical protein